MTNSLKRCPFCGSKASVIIKQIPTEKDNYIIHDFKYEYGIRCNKCRAKVGYYKSIITAENAWNKRVD